MALILCIETATEICSVALTENGNVLVLKENHQGNKHASMLTGLVQNCLDEAGKTIRQLDAVAVSKGPGSYTGLRVGVSSAKGICYALTIPLIAINTLESMASGFIKHPLVQLKQEALLIPMLDARRMEVYAAVYNDQGDTVLPTEAKIIDADSYSALLKERVCYFFGNGAAKCNGTIQSPNALFITDVHCNASSMAGLANNAFLAGTFEDTAYFEPYYLKDFVGTTPKTKK